MYKVLSSCILLFTAVAPGYSQLLSFGLKAGAPLNNAVQGNSSGGASVSTNTERWLVGPTAELHLPFRLSVEVDALYRRESYLVSSVSSVSGSPVISEWFYVAPTATTTTTTIKNSLNNWQFPFLAKYDLRGGLIRHFADGGITFRHLSGSGPINNPNTAGVTIGGGLTLKLSFLRLSPEIRYTRWGNNNLYAPSVTSSPNQTDLLVGFVF